jgi:hypothetical protein
VNGESRGQNAVAFDESGEYLDAAITGRRTEANLAQLRSAVGTEDIYRRQFAAAKQGRLGHKQLPCASSADEDLGCRPRRRVARRIRREVGADLGRKQALVSRR